MDSQGHDDCIELRRENAILKAQLAEERRRYEEIRHRIKNELQVFTTLFAAQRARCGHPEHCSLCVSRVTASAALHQELDGAHQEHCRLGAFIPRLADMLHTAFDCRFESIVTVNGDVEIDCARAKCVGLVLVEATMNAIKHGFAGSLSGTIRTRLDCTEEKVVLVVENDGKPLSSIHNVSGQGLGLVRDLARQLGGEVEISPSDMGTRLRLVFLVANSTQEDWRD